MPENGRPQLTHEEALELLDAKIPGWRHDLEGWVNIERDGLIWRAHYRSGELELVAWWGTLEDRRPQEYRTPREGGDDAAA